MTKTFATDKNNDLYIGANGMLVIAGDIDAVLANCAYAAKAMRGEMVLSVNSGMPNFQVLWVGAANIPQWEAALRQTINSVSGVTGIKNLQVSATKNVLSYTATIKTIYGEGVVSA